jgi:hypothetical protein
MTTQDSREKLSTTFFHNISQLKLNEEIQGDSSPRRSPSPTAADTLKKGKVGLSKFTFDYNEEMERVISHIEHKQTINESRLSDSRWDKDNKANCQELLQKAN